MVRWLLVGLAGCGFSATVKSASDDATTIDTSRALALWTMNEQPGAAIVQDSSGSGEPLDLVIDMPNRVTFSGSMQITNTVLIASADAATKIYDGATQTNQLTVEAWITPATTTQAGPARIVTMSVDGFARNFTLAQDGSLWIWRVRTSRNPDVNGMPNVEAPLAAGQSHVVGVNDGENRILYVNGVERARDARGGTFASWSADYRFGIGNELDGGATRDWLGEIHRVAIYARAFSTAEIQQLYDAGP